MHGPLLLGLTRTKRKKLPLGTPIEALGSARYQAADVTLLPLCDLTDRAIPSIVLGVVPFNCCSATEVSCASISSLTAATAIALWAADEQL